MNNKIGIKTAKMNKVIFTIFNNNRDIAKLSMGLRG